MVYTPSLALAVCALLMASNRALATPTDNTVTEPTVFRPGSGASGSLYPATKNNYQSNNINTLSGPPHGLLRVLMFCMPLMVIGFLVMMVPGAGQPRDFNYRIPPAWNPEHENAYSFRAYLTDIAQWVMLTDLQPHQQCAALIMRLGGAARELGRMMTPQEMYHGGSIEPGGVVVDPVTYLLGSLHARFSQLEEESSPTAMSEMLAFARRQSESINSLLARYETVRLRAALEGQFVMTVAGCSLQIIRACGMGPQHLFISDTYTHQTLPTKAKV